MYHQSYLKTTAKRKYGNIKKEYNGIIYDSSFEADQAFELDMRIKAKDIKSWERQVKLDLKVNGQHITNYYIDFIVHHNDGRREFLEVKGFETETWKLKYRIFEATFDDFKENPDDFMSVVKQSSWKQWKENYKPKK